jgi:hypothetical protein
VGRLTGNLAGLAGGVQYCRVSRKLVADLVWGNQGKFQTYSKSQKNGQDVSNNGTQGPLPQSEGPISLRPWVFFGSKMSGGRALG